MKKIVKIPLWIFLSIIILIVLAIGTLVIIYLAKKENPEEYIPENFNAYAHVKSIETVFDHLVDLKAANYILSSDSMSAINEIYMGVRSNGFLNSKMGRWLLNIEANIILTEEQEPLIVLDIGIRSIATMLFSAFESSINIDGLNYSRNKRNGKTIYEIPVSEKLNIYAAIRNNLLFISTSDIIVETTLDNKITGRNISKAETIKKIGSIANTSGFIDIYADTQQLLSNVKIKNKILTNLLKEITFEDKSALTLSLSNTNLFTEVFSLIDVTNPDFEGFLKAKMAKPDVINYAPAQANILTSLRFNSYSDFYKLFLSLTGGDFDKTINLLDGVSKTLFKLTIEELIFEWIGNEAGVFNLSTSIDPVVFLSIRDKKKFDRSMELIRKSAVMDTTSSIILDGIRLSKIEIPDWLKPLVNSIMTGFDTPYYIVKDDFVFFSMNPENLTNMINDCEAGKTIAEDPDFIEAAKENINSNIFVYYNLNENIPDIFPANSTAGNIMSQYSTGLAAFRIQEDQISMTVSAAGTRKISLFKYPGYPKKEPAGFASDIISANLIDGTSEDFVFLDKSGFLNILSKTGIRKKINCGSDARFFINSNKTLSVFMNDGTFFTYDPEDETSINRTKTATNWKKQFDIFSSDNKFYFFDIKEKKIVSVSAEGKLTEESDKASGLVFTAPVANKKTVFYYPKKINGPLYTSKNGQTEKEIQLSGVSLSGPGFNKEISDNFITMLMQDGTLYIFDKKGNINDNFPIKLNGGNYSNKAVIFRQDKELFAAAVSDTGLLSIVSLKNNTVSEKQLVRHHQKSNTITVQDFDKDNNDELFISGSGNFILGFTSDLKALKKFPVTGKGTPAFADFDKDSRNEMICRDAAENINVYFLNKNE